MKLVRIVTFIFKIFLDGNCSNIKSRDAMGFINECVVLRFIETHSMFAVVLAVDTFFILLLSK